MPRQYRSSLNAIHELFDKIRGDLTKKHQNAMDNTPFKHFFRALYDKQVPNPRRKNETLDRIFNRYHKKEKAFKVGNTFYKPTKLDVKLIFGIEDGKEEVQYKRESKPTKFNDTKLRTRLFGKANSLTQFLIKEKVKELVCKKNKTAIEDTVRLLCLLLFQSLFFANTGQTLAWGFLYFVADFKTLNSYDWSKHIICELNEGLNAEWDDPTQVNGCTLLLQYWYCEHCKETCETYEKKMKPIQIPRITKWEASDLDEAFEKAAATDEGLRQLRFKWSKLIPTPAEEELIPSLKEMSEVDELPVSDDCDNEQEHPEKNKKIAELEQEVLRLQHQLDGQRIEFQTKLDEEVALRMELTSQLKRLEAENESLMAQLHPPAPRGVLRPPGNEGRRANNRRVTFNAQMTVFLI